MLCVHRWSRLTSFIPIVWTAAVLGQTVSLTPVTTPQLWKRHEFRIDNVPASTNPFDPNLIRVDATVTSPAGRVQRVPAFWYQAYGRQLINNHESLTASGSPDWRLRLLPTESGTYQVAIAVRTNNVLWGTPASASFAVPAAPAPAQFGYAHLATNSANQYFETTDGQALRLIGENVCWDQGRGTYDYDTWFLSLQNAGENFARLWMCPWAFNLETDANSLNRYRLDRAWQLDYVLRLAETRGIYLMLCLDYHGMYEVEPDYWGGNNMWPTNPYNATNGGPCLNPNGFFTNATAQTIYQKRLRYLVGRYGYSPNLLCWEFFNEIDNVYGHLVPGDVANWHTTMARWMRTNDPFGHLLTTSLTGSSDRPEIWQIPELDFAQYHSYGEAGIAGRLNEVAQSFLGRYRKPVLIGEYGVDFRGWSREADPYLRGFRQGLWGGALGGSAGTGMSWWWENIHSENVYPYYSALGAILKRTGWGRGSWTNLTFVTSGTAPPTVGDPLSGGQPFSVTLPLSGGWGTMVPGYLAVPNAGAAAQSASVLNSFVHGSSKADIRRPFVLSAWFTNAARLVMHVNSVSSSPTLVVKADGAELYRTNLPNLDGYWQVTNEYNLDISINLPAGKHSIAITNVGGDWVFLDWVRLEGVLPAAYPGGWTPSPAAIGLRGAREALAYVINPYGVYPGGATNVSLTPLLNQSLVISNLAAGKWHAEWYDPRTGTNVLRTSAVATNQVVGLPIPALEEDLVAVIYPSPRLQSGGCSNGVFTLRLETETGGVYDLQRSTNFLGWQTLERLTNKSGSMTWSAPIQSPGACFRLLKP